MHTSFFNMPGNWYRGSLHCHTTLSDGAFTPEQLRDEYRRLGFQFACFSDHEYFCDHAALDLPDFVTLPGVERSMDIPDDPRQIHLNGICGTRAMLQAATLPPYPNGAYMDRTPAQESGDAQQIIDDMTARGMLVFYNHPHWSMVDAGDIAGLRGLHGVEIYNHLSFVQDTTAFGSIVWETLLRKKMRLHAFATDDCHCRPHCPDAGGGYIWVKAPALDRESLVSAISQGHFYASMGPRIESFTQEGDTLILRSSPAERLFILTDSRQAIFAGGPDGENTVTELRYTLHGNEAYARAEVLDCHGKRAWSNPIYFE